MPTDLTSSSGRLALSWGLSLILWQWCQKGGCCLNCGASWTMTHPLQDVLVTHRSTFSNRLLPSQCIIEHHKKSFLPVAIKLYNSSTSGREVLTFCNMGLHLTIHQLLFNTIVNQFTSRCCGVMYILDCFTLPPWHHCLTCLFIHYGLYRYYLVLSLCTVTVKQLTCPYYISVYICFPPC